MDKKILSLGICFLALTWANGANAGCSVHDHNCLHGSYPFAPELGNIPSGPATLNIMTGYGGAPDVDLNQHVALPPGSGPFVASGSDGNPVEATPLGGGANVIYHNQQTVQYGNGSAGGQLTSTPGSELTTMIGNVSEGTYAVAVYNYDLDELGLTGSYNTVATAGGTGHFDAPSQSHTPTGYVYTLDLGGGSLAPDQASGAVTFNYYNNEFQPHASGIYVIPGGDWNIGGVRLDQLSMFATADGSEGFMTYGGYTLNTNPYDLQGVKIYGYDDALYDPNTGLFFKINQRENCVDNGGDQERCSTLNQVSGLVTSPSALRTLGTAIGVTGEIEEGYGKVGKAHTWDYYHNQYDQARKLLGCPSCSEKELIAISMNKSTSLDSRQQQLFDEYIAKAYAGESLYGYMKKQKRRGNIRLAMAIAGAAVMGPAIGSAAEFAAAGATGTNALTLAAYSGEIGALAGGAAGGFTGTLMATGDIDQALKAGVTGAAFSGIDVLNLSPIYDTGAKALVGGASAEWSGGDFNNGFNLVALTTGAGHVYEHIVGYGVDPGPGGDAVTKGPDVAGVEGANNFGTAEETLDPNCIWCEGGRVSVVANQVPIMNATAGAHDQWQVWLQNTFGEGVRNNVIANVAGMPPSFVLATTGALAPAAPILINTQDNY